MKILLGITALAVTALAVGGYAHFQPQNMTGAHDASTLAKISSDDDMHVTLHKDPNCGCCEGYAAALRREGFTVTVESADDLAAVKEHYNIPPEEGSCHTAVIGNYVVEGHVPLEAVEKLLTEQPDIAGIGLARMPAGTPGMPGIKRAPYEVYQLNEAGETSPYLTI